MSIKDPGYPVKQTLRVVTKFLFLSLKAHGLQPRQAHGLQPVGLLFLRPLPRTLTPYLVVADATRKLLLQAPHDWLLTPFRVVDR